MELHTNLAHGPFWNNVDYEEYFKKLFYKCNRKEYHIEKFFSQEDYFIYLCFHLAKHLYSSGVGVRQFMDIAVFLNHYMQNMDWEYIYNELNKLKLKKFFDYMIYICQKWFHVNARFLQISQIDNTVVDKLEEYILSGGTFGFERDANIRRLRKGYTSKSSNRQVFVTMRALCKLVFLDRKSMEDFLPALEKFPFLLPIAWMKRWWILLHQKERVKKSLDNFGENISEAEEQWKLLKKIGL